MRLSWTIMGFLRRKTVLAPNAIPVPVDFPTEAYERVNQRVSAAFNSYQAAWNATGKPGSAPPWGPWQQYAAAWRAVLYRFASTSSHDEAFTKRIRFCGRSPELAQQYALDDDLFGFFVKGLSTMESFCYAVYSVGAMIDPSTFHFITTNLRRIDVGKTRQAYSEAYAGEGLTNSLQDLDGSSEFAEWNTIRNVLAHRISPSRTFFVGGPRDGRVTAAIDSTCELSIDDTTTGDRRKWLATTVRNLIEQADAFTDKYPPTAPSLP